MGSVRMMMIIVCSLLGTAKYYKFVTLINSGGNNKKSSSFQTRYKGREKIEIYSGWKKRNCYLMRASALTNSFTLWDHYIITGKEMCVTQ